MRSHTFLDVRAGCDRPLAADSGRHHFVGEHIMRTRLMALGVVAGLAHADASFAQDQDRLIGMGAIKLLPGGEGFSGRSVSVIYATPVDLRGYSDGGFPKRAGDDVDFAPGPAGNGSNGAGGVVVVSGAAWGVVVPAGATDTVVDTSFTFFDVFQGWFGGTFPGASLIGERTYWAIFITPGYTTFFDTSSPATMPDFGTPVEVALNAGPDAFVTIEVRSSGTTNLHSTAWIVASGPALSVGSSDPQRWGDSNGDGVVQANELNSITPRRLYLGLQGEAPPPLPPISVDFGCLQDGLVSASLGATAPGAVRWLAFCASNPVEDSLLRYLDIDTAGTTGDTAIQLVDLAGATIGALDSDRAGNDQGMISVGVGRRASASGGAQFDGWAGDLSNQNGNRYFVAVRNDALVAVNPQVNIRTNLNSGENGPVVPPVTNGVAYGVLASGTNQGQPQQLTRDSVDSVRWSTFHLSASVCVDSGSLRLDFVSQSAPIADVVAWVFDAAGNIVAFGDDGLGSPANKPDIRFGVGGNSGGLSAGTYYLAVALFDPNNSDLSSVPGNDRFHVRGRSGSSVDAGCDFNYTPGLGTNCLPIDCPSIDFNNDSSFYDPLDIEAFLSVFSEGPCIPATAICSDIDFNNDGSRFDPCDIDVFLSVFNEGPCLPCGL
jgi:hypothetical protein